jgi:hypothetical protein
MDNRVSQLMILPISAIARTEGSPNQKTQLNRFMILRPTAVTFRRERREAFVWLTAARLSGYAALYIGA